MTRHQLMTDNGYDLIQAVWFTALFPYLILTILLIRAATLPGFMDGIWFYLTPRWELLLKANVWGDAAMQIFFSLSPCWGGLITLASYNRFHNDCFRCLGLIPCLVFVLLVVSDRQLTVFFLSFSLLFLFLLLFLLLFHCFRDALLVATGNVLTSFYAGLVIFGIIGFLAHDLNVDVDSVSTQGSIGIHGG